MSASTKKGHVSKWRRKLTETDREIRPLEDRATKLRNYRQRVLQAVSMLENAL